MPHGITQCYLPPGTGDIPALTPAEAGTRVVRYVELKSHVCQCVVVKTSHMSKYRDAPTG